MTDDWYGLYGEGWQGEIVPEAFAHPAKFSRALIRHIYRHLLDEGLVQPGDTVVDPFGGVALGSLDAMRCGLHWTGVELEPRFVDLGQQNIDRWLAQYAPHFPGWGTARLVQGDSRELARVLSAAGACVSSPPYAESLGNADRSGIDWSKQTDRDTSHPHGWNGTRYGITKGNLGNLPPGDLGGAMREGAAASVTSPPFEESLSGKGKCPDTRPDGTPFGEGRSITLADYGTSPGNIGNDTGTTFWTAARDIVAQLYQVLRPGAPAVFVVKSFVRKGERVDFPGQWRQLCEACGFEAWHEHRAWVVEDRGSQWTLDGNLEHKEIKRCSFFRRLAEAKGSPKIDWETVLCMVKPT